MFPKEVTKLTSVTTLRSMKKLFVLVLSAVLLVSGLPANAAVKAGAKCKVVGQIKVNKNKEFTCIKKGSKVIWNKGVVLKSKAVSFSEFKKSKPKENLTFSNL